MSKSIFSKFRLSRLTASFIRPVRNIEQQVNVIHAETREQLLASLRRMLEPAEAEEVLQEAYLKLFVALRDDKALAPRPFLFRVARNLAISVLRRKKVMEKYDTNAGITLHDTTQMEAVERRVSREEEQRALVAAINALPPKCRQVFVMRKIDGLSHEQIARILDISHKTVENHLARGMRLCREHITAGRSDSPVAAVESEYSEEKVLAAR